MSNTDRIAQLLERIASALESTVSPRKTSHELKSSSAYVWEPDQNDFIPVEKVNAVPLELLRSVDQQKKILTANTRQFADGFPANNALLWGARGMGKSSLVKAVHGEIVKQSPELKLIEIHRDDITTLPLCLKLVKQSPFRIVLYCDDLSFEPADNSYKSLKAVLDGGLDGRPENVLFYATSNRRHLMPRDMIENERSTAINPAEAVEEKISLSDRFGIWIGFHNCSQDDYLSMINGYAAFHQLHVPSDQLKSDAIEWAATRGSRSGRVAWQFIQDLAGRQKKRL